MPTRKAATRKTSTRKTATPKATPKQAPRKTTRIPKTPEPGTFEYMIAPHPADVQKVAKRLRTVVKQAVPDAQEGIVGGAKVGLVLYSLKGPDDVLCGIQPGKDACLFYIHHLKDMESAAFKLEGKGQHALHIKFKSLADVKTKPIKDMLAQARQLGEQLNIGEAHSE
jgi:hypothetical protein